MSNWKPDVPPVEVKMESDFYDGSSPVVVYLRANEISKRVGRTVFARYPAGASVNGRVIRAEFDAEIAKLSADDPVLPLLQHLKSKIRAEDGKPDFLMEEKERTLDG